MTTEKDDFTNVLIVGDHSAIEKLIEAFRILKRQHPQRLDCNDYNLSDEVDTQALLAYYYPTLLIYIGPLNIDSPQEPQTKTLIQRWCAERNVHLRSYTKDNIKHLLKQIARGTHDQQTVLVESDQYKKEPTTLASVY